MGYPAPELLHRPFQELLRESHQQLAIEFFPLKDSLRPFSALVAKSIPGTQALLLTNCAVPEWETLERFAITTSAQRSVLPIKSVKIHGHFVPHAICCGIVRKTIDHFSPETSNVGRSKHVVGNHSDPVTDGSVVRR